MSRFKNQEKAAAGEENFSIHINYKIIIHNRQSIDISPKKMKRLWQPTANTGPKFCRVSNIFTPEFNGEKQKLIFVIVPPCEVRLKID